MPMATEAGSPPREPDPSQGHIERKPCPSCGSTRTQPFPHAGPGARVNMRCNDCATLFKDPHLRR